jgi:hypothetical protein
MVLSPRKKTKTNGSILFIYVVTVKGGKYVDTIYWHFQPRILPVVVLIDNVAVVQKLERWLSTTFVTKKLYITIEVHVLGG